MGVSEKPWVRCKFQKLDKTYKIAGKKINAKCPETTHETIIYLAKPNWTVTFKKRACFPEAYKYICATTYLKIDIKYKRSL